YQRPSEKLCKEIVLLSRFETIFEIKKAGISRLQISFEYYYLIRYIFPYPLLKYLSVSSPSALYLSSDFPLRLVTTLYKYTPFANFDPNWSVPSHLNSVIFLPICNGPNSSFVISLTIFPVIVMISILIFCGTSAPVIVNTNAGDVVNGFG